MLPEKLSSYLGSCDECSKTASLRLGRELGSSSIGRIPHASDGVVRTLAVMQRPGCLSIKETCETGGSDGIVGGVEEVLQVLSEDTLVAKRQH